VVDRRNGAIYAADDVNGTQIGMYHCFGAWTSAADAADAPYLRLTTVQFLMDEGSIMGLIVCPKLIGFLICAFGHVSR
jgi:hypothetical protein